MRKRSMATWVLLVTAAGLLGGCSVWRSLPLVGDSYAGGVGQTPSGFGYSEPD